jgi:hypothetical protein
LLKDLTAATTAANTPMATVAAKIAAEDGVAEAATTHSPAKATRASASGTGRMMRLQPRRLPNPKRRRRF